jgi:hypothetical protein
MNLMVSRLPVLVLPLSLALFAADEQTWKTKQVADWTDADARQVLKDSPWVKNVTASVTQQSNQNQVPRRGYGRRGGFGYPGGGYPGGGYPGGGYPGGGGGYPGGGGGYPGGSGGQGRQDQSNAAPPKLKLRWESAQPIREAELKARDTDAPTIDPDHYALAVYGVPRSFANGDPQKLADQYKKDAALKRDGKKDLKPSSVQVLSRDDGPVVVFLFPRAKNEITAQDRRVEFEAKIGRLQVSESFFTEDMNYQGKLEL